ncbi:MAG: DNA-3-methyladenine glycosylase 2 family protein [Alphaproteobacteria bacterium]|nr:DNA-3-methyladenine glycosylase 2 family protein [Alphaproteobacteria bacterium]MBU0798660.1 DNA-3-methyladenine glycosylase 2 family protein [Alphaproteobacteria bacterium]MBU0885923.1 DNA-3-methyladenine glycosylase 2 family protein [Alphaproteobacteria bacterium]MBU1811912.1 DNA-3-methyladenine glycosylase 2 family protein [Alphaproteobacteria bacterium]
MSLTQERQAALAEDMAALARRDPDIAAAVALVGLPPPRVLEPGFASLLGIIVEQQVSVASGKAIQRKLLDAFGTVTAEAVCAADDATLLGCGLSRPKLRYTRILALEVAERRLALDDLHGLSDAEAMARLTALTGIGRWTAEIYLMFALGRRDIWPALDLALQVAVQDIKRLETRPGAKVMDAVAAPWQPQRSAAALLFWRYYRHLRQRPGTADI